MASSIFLIRELGILASLILARSRSFRQDAQIWEKSRLRSTRILGRENIPESGPGLITINHYFRPGFRAWWMTLAISAVVPHDIHWVMTNGWTYRGKKFGEQRTGVTRIFFNRIARIYGFTTMPPMPPNPSETEKRAQSVRRVLTLARRGPNILIGLAPEGGDSQTGDLQDPPSGVGRFILHLVQSGLIIYPVGVFEDNEQLCVNFGKPYRPVIPSECAAEERDRAGREIVMGHIAQLIPASLRGAYIHAAT